MGGRLLGRQIVPDTLACVMCGATFETGGEHGVYTCSEACAAELEKQKEVQAAIEREMDLEQEVVYGESEAEKARGFFRQWDQAGLRSNPSGVVDDHFEVSTLIRTPAPVLAECGQALLAVVVALSADPDLAVRASDLVRDVLHRLRVKLVLGGDDDRREGVRGPADPADGEGPGAEAPGDEGEGEAPGGHPEGGLRAGAGDVQGEVGVEVPRPGRDGWDPTLVGGALERAAQNWIDDHDHMFKDADTGFPVDRQDLPSAETLGRIMHDVAYSAFREGVKKR